MAPGNADQVIDEKELENAGHKNSSGITKRKKFPDLE